MQPNDPQQNLPAQNPADYLDQISAPQKVQTMNPMVLWGMIGGVLLAVILVLILLFSSAGPSQTDQLGSYGFRLEQLRTLADENSNNIKSSELRSHNSTMHAILTGARQQLDPFLAAADITSLEKTPGASAVTTEFSELTTTLEDARLNARFDHTYAREISYQLSHLRTELELLQGRADGELKTYLEETDRNIMPLTKQFRTFNNAQS